MADLADMAYRHSMSTVTFPDIATLRAVYLSWQIDTYVSDGQVYITAKRGAVTITADSPDTLRKKIVQHVSRAGDVPGGACLAP